MGYTAHLPVSRHEERNQNNNSRSAVISELCILYHAAPLSEELFQDIIEQQYY